MGQLSPIVSYEHASIMLKVTAASAVVLIGLFEFSLVGMRKYAASREMRPSTGVFLASCCSSMLNALAGSGMAISSFYEMVSAGPVTLTMPVPEPLVYSCAITVGYFIADCYQMTRYYADNKREMGTNGMTLMWVHHFISLVLWPYAILTQRCAIFVAFFLCTEVTNIGQNIFHFCNKSGYSAKATMLIGVLWGLSFFGVRVVPLPWLLYHYGRLFFFQLGAGMTTGESIAAGLTVPLPFMLNVYWFDLIIKKARRMAKGSDEKKGN